MYPPPAGYVLTADGCQPVVKPVPNGCCPLPPCGFDSCCFIVNFLQLLPSGPLWDYWKAKAISYFQQSPTPQQPPLSDRPPYCSILANPECPSIILHAVYTVFRLKDIVDNALWPAFRESDPQTSVSTMDNWLAQMQWEDCYRQHCRSQLLGDITPYEVRGDCGPLYCDFAFPQELEDALKHNILRSLARAQMGVIRNLCGINWIIEPLNAVLTPIQAVDCNGNPIGNPTPGTPDGDLQIECQGWCPPDIKFLIDKIGDTMDGAGSGILCDQQKPQVQAYLDLCLDQTPMGLPSTIWPGVIAADCIVRSLMPPTCPSNIVRAC